MKTIQYVISEKCNMNCVYCNVDKKTNNYLTLDNFKHFKKDTLDKLNSEYILDIFGGEAFLFADIVLKIVQILEQDNKCISIRIPTNGTVFNRTVNAIINSPKVAKIMISHDGVYQTENRGSQKIYFKSLRANSVHLMLTGTNFENHENIFIEQDKYFREINVKCNMMFIRDKGAFTNEQALLFDKQFKDYLYYVLQFQDEWKTLNDIPGLIRQYLVQFLSYAINKNKFTGCSAGIDHLSYTDKKLIGCTRFSKTKDNYKLAKYNEYISECDTCTIKDFCGTGCKHEIIQNNGIIPELCIIYKSLFRSIKQIITEETGKIMLDLYLESN